jgi:hypothetical protein
VWYGEVDGPSSTSTLEFDVVCFFVADAERAAREDGLVDDFNSYVRNKNSKVRRVPVCDGATFALVTGPILAWAKVDGWVFIDEITDAVGTPTYPSTSGLGVVLIRPGQTCASAIMQVYTP